MFMDAIKFSRRLEPDVSGVCGLRVDPVCSIFDPSLARRSILHTGDKTVDQV